MPGRDGWSLLKECKTDKELKDIPVIMISQLNQSNLAASLGANDYLTKPIDRSHFVNTIQRLLGTGGKDQKVLVIDDDKVVHELLHRNLQRLGFKIESAFSGRDGIFQAERLRPAVIILDVLMSDMDGWDVLNVLNGQDELSGIPVIMLTMVDDKKRGYAMGVSGYLQKPAKKEDLVLLLDKYIDRSLKPDVLVVEDNSDMRELLRRELEDLQCVVREAENGIQAISEYNQKQPDLIILDLMMPKMDGFEFVEYLRDNYQEWAPIVVMTAKDITMEDRERLNGAMKKILSKDNFSNQKLEDIVGEILVNWQQFQQ
jgi:hypothetical protein